MVADVRALAGECIAAAMVEWSSREMAWGVDDCMLAVANVVRDVTGKDPAKSYRGRYHTRVGAGRALGRGGVADAATAAAKALKWKRIPPDRAQPGDVGLVAFPVKRAKGQVRVSHVAVICRAPGWFIGRNEWGFTALPAARVTHAWSIA